MTLVKQLGIGLSIAQKKKNLNKDYLLQKNEYQTGGGVGLNGIAWAL
jgi:hypothetical protein